MLFILGELGNRNVLVVSFIEFLFLWVCLFVLIFGIFIKVNK